MAYYDIDAILTDAQVCIYLSIYSLFPFCTKKVEIPMLTKRGAWGNVQKLPCTFELEVPGLGYLDGNVGEDVCFILFFLFCPDPVVIYRASNSSLFLIYLFSPPI